MGMSDVYLLHIHMVPSFECAERYYAFLRQPAALLKFADGTGGVAFIDRRPVFEGQRPYDAGVTEVKRNFASKGGPTQP